MSTTSKIRHPEKASRPDNPSPSKPEWIKVKAPTSKAYSETLNLMRAHGLNTVCEEAACPNIGECWSNKHATLMILGDICTRACAFCNVATGKPKGVDKFEPEKVGISVAKLGLRHVVVTSVDRDDLADGGAAQFVATIQALRRNTPGTTIEVLTPDFRGKDGAVEAIVNAKPDVFNHNLETVNRLYPTIRPGARYDQSLIILDQAKQIDPQIFTKSGIMVGFGEQKDEILELMDDLRSVNVDFMTIGQYLQPTPKHAGIDRFLTLDEFDQLKRIGLAKGFLHVAATPLTRSSYHADEDFSVLRSIRQERAIEF